MDLVRNAFELLTGHAPKDEVVALVGEVASAAELRNKILRSPRLYARVPEFCIGYEIVQLRRARARGSIRIVVGAAGTQVAGWVSTNQHSLDLLREATWHAFLEPDSVQAILAEHVWEHLDEEGGRRALATCFTFLKPGGHLRIAVPDALHPSQEYRNYAGVGGMFNHKVFYDHRLLGAALESVGFVPKLLEYWTEDGEFIHQPWSKDDGPVARSRWNDRRNADGKPNFTSLIVDGVKPPA
jgi:predicted SAM-dependent methyltransferase